MSASFAWSIYTGENFPPHPMLSKLTSLTGENTYMSWAEILDCGNAPLTFLDNTVALRQLEKAHKVSNLVKLSSQSPRVKICDATLHRLHIPTHAYNLSLRGQRLSPVDRLRQKRNPCFLVLLRLEEIIRTFHQTNFSKISITVEFPSHIRRCYQLLVSYLILPSPSQSPTLAQKR